MQQFIGQKNQRIRIGRDIVLTFLKICAGQVRCVLEAPKGFEITREFPLSETSHRKRDHRNHSARQAQLRTFHPAGGSFSD